MAIGLIETGQAYLYAAPTDDNHAVPLWYLKKAFGGFLDGVEIGPGTLFPKVRNNVEKKAVYVDEEGFLSATGLTETAGAERTLGFVKDGRLYLNNMVVKGLSGLQTGRAYWIQTDGTVAVTPTTQDDLWSVRLGMAISTENLIINIHIPGGV